MARIRLDGSPQWDERGPFVWCEPWLYSYCKATGLRRRPRRNGAYVTIGSTIIFVDKETAKRKALLIDTVFCVGAVHEWKRGQPPRSLRLALASQYEQAYERHLRFGIPKGSN